MATKIRPLNIPDRIMDRVDAILDMKEKAEQAEKKRKLEKDRRDKELEELRKIRFIDLTHYAVVVLDWISNLLHDENGKKLLRAVGSIRVFSAPFWQGMPVPEAKATTFATVELDSRGNVTYKERYKGMPAHETKLGKSPLSVNTLFEKLHPDYLKALAEHLSSEAVWDYIEMSMPQKI